MRTTDIKNIGTLCTWFLLCLVLLAAAIGKPTVANETAGSVVFYYGANPAVKFELGGSPAHCQMMAHGKVIHGEETTDGHVRFNLSTKDTGNANIDCKS